MDNTATAEKDNSSPQASSPNSSTSSSSISVAARTAMAPPPPLTPKSIQRPADPSNPFPTTFVQADTSSFKQVVQMLTGSAETAAKHAGGGGKSPPQPPPPAVKATAPKRPAFKLYERRSSLRNLKVISPLLPATFSSSSPARFSPRKQTELLSPSMLDFPSLVLSPVTPLIHDPFNRPPQQIAVAAAEEDRAIAEKGFYLHPSPRSAGGEPPRLLPLFPLTSPRASSSSP